MNYRNKYFRYKKKYLLLKGGTNKLVIDHVMFPIYNNNDLLTEIEAEWKKNNNYLVTIGEQNQLFKGIYLDSKNFYIEQLSTTKGNAYWSNAIAIVLDKKYWDYVDKPDEISEHFMTPKYGCGYFIVDPNYQFTHQKINKSDYDNFTIHVSKELAEALTNLAGMQWVLPEYIKVSDVLCQAYDIIVTDNNKHIAPLFQANTPLLD